MMADDRGDGEYGAGSEEGEEGEDGEDGAESEDDEVREVDKADEAGEDDEVGGVWDADLPEAAVVSCPHCGAEVDLLIDAGGGPIQEYVEDCEVCCRPWLVRVVLKGDGRADVDVRTLDQ
jgi:hypothetical protein